MVKQTTPLIEVRHLKKYFPIKRGILFQRRIGDIKAVDDVSVRVAKGRTLGVVGESGCGKSSLVKGLIGLEPVTGGQVMLN